MLKKIIFIIFSIFTVSCAAPKHITVEKETIEKTVVKDSIIYRDSIVYFPKERIVIIGSEELGVSPEVLKRADYGRVSIPMTGLKASLNVGVAFGILMQAWVQLLSD